jgi:hypothetical protein
VLGAITGRGRAASCSCEWELLRYASCCILSCFYHAADDDCTRVSKGYVYTQSEQHTRKGFLNIHHFPCARLHESKIMLPAPLQPISCSDLPDTLQIAFVTSDNAHRQDLVLLHPIFPLHVDHLCEVIERFERAGLGDVIDEEECVAFQIRLRPEAAVFLLTSGVCESKRVCCAVDRSCNGVGILNRRIISVLSRQKLPMDSKSFARKTYSCVH